MLEALTQSDKEACFYCRNEYDIYKWCRQVGPLNWPSHDKWWNSLADRDDVRMFSIKKLGVFVGVCGLTSIDYINRRAEFSLYISKEHQGYSYAITALGELFTFAFKQLGLNVVWGETFSSNGAAKMFEKIGMVKEGTRREFYYRDGKFIDAHLYSIKASEWKY